MNQRSSSLVARFPKWLLVAVMLGGPAACVDDLRSPPTAIAGNWRAIEIAGTLELGPGDRARGQTACNNYEGKFRTRGTAISFTAISRTLMGCEQKYHDAETRFLGLLEAVDRYRLSPQGHLLLVTSNGRTLRFEKAPDIPVIPHSGDSMTVEHRVTDFVIKGQY
jgi:heat shock protein HslJ